MFRAELRERRDQLRHPNYEKPVLLATGPNQVWSWDITKLLGPMKWVYFHLYVILDIFSRYVVGWMLAERESAELAKRLIKETCSKQGIVAEQLTLHADRGTSMKSKPLAMHLTRPGNPLLFITCESRRFLIRDSPRPATTYEQKTGGADGVKGA